MKLTESHIRSLIGKKEDERVEFKRASSELPDNLWETYSAFCNTDGGTIILGIREGKNKKTFKIAADGITRIDDTPVHKALREVLANALIHADYHGRCGIVVEKHFRTITFSNLGTMRISKSVAVAGGTSDARNTAIFNIFALVDIGERSGMGLANLHGLWKKYGYAEPKITESYDPGRTVIVVTTDDDTENDTVTRPESGAEPDQKCPKSAPEVPQKCPNGAPRGDNNFENDTVNKSRAENDTVNDTVKHSQPRTRTTPVQHPYNEPKFRTTTVPVQDPNEFDYLPVRKRKRLNHRGPLSIDVSSAWYFITICAEGHAPWIADEVKIGRAVATRSPSIDLMAEKRSAA